jgi:hypothetical protein
LVSLVKIQLASVVGVNAVATMAAQIKEDAILICSSTGAIARRPPTPGLRAPVELLEW